MDLDRNMSSAVQRELNAKIEEDRAYKQEVYERLKRLRKYRRENKYTHMKWFQSIIGCVKCY